MRIFVVKLLIFCILLILLEFILRMMGFQSGSVYPGFRKVKTISSEQLFKGTPEGMTVFDKESKDVPHDYEINNQGFRSPFDFKKEVADSLRLLSEKPHVFLVGDSYTQGCCTSSVTNSFSDKLERIVVYNFGVGGADLVQYDLILDKYLDLLKPDLVVIPFYLGNDKTADIRTPQPNIPVIYRIKDSFWLSSEVPSYLSDEYPKPYFESAQEAYDFYRHTYTFWGDDRTIWEKIASKSVILTQLFKGLPLKIKGQLDYYKTYEGNKEQRVTNELLQKIKAKCQEQDTPLLICPIPAPQDAANQKDLSEQYQAHFEGMNVCYPTISKYFVALYDNTEHFTDEGHGIYASELQNCIDQELRSNSAASLAK